VSGKIRDDRLRDLTPEETLAYRRYPNDSLELALGRKLSIDPKLRELILSVNERADGTGFPRNLPAHKIPHGSQLIRFCSMLDQRTLVKLGAQRQDPREVLKKLAQEVSDDPGSTSTDFAAQLRKTFIDRPIS